jgi:hypothetical protein
MRATTEAASVGAAAATRLLASDDVAVEVVADYSYPPSSFKTVRCCRGRLVGRINVMREVSVPPGKQHPVYPGVRTRIACIVPSGWQMLPVTVALITVIPIAMLLSIDPLVARYGCIPVGLCMLVTLVGLLRTSTKDPGIFPRYRVPQGEKWTLCMKTNSYR